LGHAKWSGRAQHVSDVPDGSRYECREHSRHRDRSRGPDARAAEALATEERECALRGDRQQSPEQHGALTRIALEERPDRDRVQLGSRDVADDLERFLVRDGGSVGPLGSERIEGVCDGNDARAGWDLLPGHSGRISGPVEALVVVPNHRRDLRVLHHRDDLGTLRCVLPNDLELRRGKRASLIEHLRGNSELAEVVNGSRGSNLRDLLTRLAHPLGDHRGMQGNAARVTVRVWILGVQCGGHSPEDLGPPVDALVALGQTSRRITEA
jgi:hypothetical protein